MRTIIAYSTLTGNTETAAEWIGEYLQGAGHTVRLEQADNIYPGALADYDLIILGSPTYWGGDVTDDFVPFLNQMEGLNLSRKKAAVFGLGDSAGYPDEFCQAADLLEKRLVKCGATLAAPTLKLDGDPSDKKHLIQDWVNSLS
jgi:flavodoxin I